jgi:hypothetical protein
MQVYTHACWQTVTTHEMIEPEAVLLHETKLSALQGDMCGTQRFSDANPPAHARSMFPPQVTSTDAYQRLFRWRGHGCEVIFVKGPQPSLQVPTCAALFEVVYDELANV